jgi:chaperonin cofactor prefoldin
MACDVEKDNERLRARVKSLEDSLEELKRLLADMYRDIKK